MIEIIINIVLVFVLISTFLFPFLVELFYKGKEKKDNPKISNGIRDNSDKISHIICAYNEEKFIYKKLINSLSIDYPCDYEVIVISDGSTDRTDEEIKRVKSHKIKYLRQENKGKSIAQNLGVKNATGNILLFSDANSFFKRDSVIRLYSKLKVGYGCVGANVLYWGKKGYNPERSYYKIEANFKRFLGKKGILISVHGGGYMVRKELYEELPSFVLSDLLTPLIVLMKNKKVGFEESAQVFEPPVPDDFLNIIRRRRRIFLRGINSILYFIKRYFINLVKRPDILFFLLFYKILRYFISLIFLLTIITAIFTPYFYKIIFVSGLITLVFSYWFLPQEKMKKKLKFFWALIIASFLALFDFLRRKKYHKWSPRGD